MKYKAIICDLDGTLLNEHHTISEETQETIKEIVNSGVKFIIATGRHHNDAMTFKDMLGLDSFLITSNGAKVHDYSNNEIISHNIPAELAKDLLNYNYNEELHKNIYLDEEWFVERPLEEALLFHKESGFHHIVTPFENLVGKDITKFFFISQNEEAIASLEKNLRAEFTEGFNITLSLGSCLEIMKDGVSKASAIEEVLKREGICIKDTIAFGDGLNDLEMLSSVGRGFIMGNGSPRLKALLPENEVIKTNSENGVAQKLRELFL
ncbi:Cof-type HAD-IIB family hydrolase [uncultured Cetobacterium sp.]|uniref:Cof-type HAD-IIB family hydrolase n=1 Tax=uncultured Cetobacterium sp. TaxID=527638 RepID=UPI0025DFF56A|nr:Cof-type HAD-IIB family hydrolase [uncultured Cetobacterium sp.]